MPLAELAQRLNVSYSVMWRWERGLSSPRDIKVVRQLEELFGRKWEELSKLVDN